MGTQVEGTLAAHAADLSWARALAAGEDEAVARFERELIPEVGRVLRGRGLSAEDVEELQQQLRVHLLVGDGSGPLVAQYGGRGPLRSWVLVCAVRKSLALRRRAGRESAAPDEVLVALVDRASTAVEADLAACKERYREHFRRAFRRALAALEPKARTLLRLHAIDGLTIDELGALEGVHRATAARRLERARDQLFADTRAELMAELGTGRLEADSVLRWVKSCLDLSLAGLAPGGASDPP